MKNVICFIMLCAVTAGIQGIDRNTDVKTVECTYEFEVMKCSK